MGHLIWLQCRLDAMLPGLDRFFFIFRKNANNYSDFMGPHHVNPAEAVRIHQMVRSKKSFGIHWGTFAMGSKEVSRQSPEIKSSKALF
jgi:hypothetical protein